MESAKKKQRPIDIDAEKEEVGLKDDSKAKMGALGLVQNGLSDARFPSLPAFLVRVEVRDTPQYGVGHRGVFALETISKGERVWLVQYFSFVSWTTCYTFNSHACVS